MDPGRVLRSMAGSMPRPGAVLLPGPAPASSRRSSPGVTLAALALPLNIGYAEASGLPAIVGINAALLPILAFALFSGSRAAGARARRHRRRPPRRAAPGRGRRERGDADGARTRRGHAHRRHPHRAVAAEGRHVGAVHLEVGAGRASSPAWASRSSPRRSRRSSTSASTRAGGSPTSSRSSRSCPRPRSPASSSA